MHRAAAAAASEKVECLVVGAGAVGLAVARQLASDGRNVLLVEAEAGIGTGASSRNSQVIHAGIYYPPGSLKATLCVEGSRALLTYCRQHGIAHQRLGKLIVATCPQHRDALRRLQEIGNRNGVQHLRMLTARQAMQLEPHLQCLEALWSPSTGIIDSHAYMLSLQADAELEGATFAFNTAVSGGIVAQDGRIHVCTSARTSSELVLSAEFVINCAGLHAQAVARSIQGLRQGSIPRSFFAKGCYFGVASSAKPFSRLIYPVPEEGGLGIHLTLDLQGHMRFGPDVEWILNGLDTPIDIGWQFGYGVDPGRADKFYSEIRRYYPALPDGCLVPDYAGIRAKVKGPGEQAADFIIQGDETHGARGLINLFGIESPGLTSSLAIARVLGSMIQARKACC